MLKLYKFIFNKSLKNFSFGFVVSSGRNFLGRICVQHQGGSSKIKYILIDRFRHLNQFGYIIRIIRDINRSAYIGLVFYDNGLSSFILLSEGLLKGSRIFSGDLKLYYNSMRIGSTQKLLDIGLFENINAIELFPFSGIKLARSAGTFSKIISKSNEKSVLKLNSGWIIKVSNHSLATFGIMSNLSWNFNIIKKAGINRIRGIRPTVRGVIKNPCDHPHGGGEGRGSPPVAQVSPWGWLCKGRPSKNKKIDRLNRKLFKKI